MPSLGIVEENHEIFCYAVVLYRPYISVGYSSTDVDCMLEGCVCTCLCVLLGSFRYWNTYP